MAEHEYYEVNGRQIRVRPTESGQEIDEYGNFHRQPNHFTKGFGEGENPVEADRYILFWGKGCNWSNRASIARELLGLDKAIKVEIVDWGDYEKPLGWEFVNSPNHINKETGAQFLSELYYNADDDYEGRTTVPALVDYKEKIKKLLSLSKSPNEHEAQSALAKAQQLMAEHKISMAEVEDKEKRKANEHSAGITYSTRRDPWVLRLSKVISKNYCCESFSRREKGKQTYKLYFCGLNEDVEICMIAFKYATDCIQSEIKKRKQKGKLFNYTNELVTSMCNGYAYGFIKGLDEAFEEQKRAAAQSEANWGLVLSTPPEVKQRMSELGLKTTTFRSKQAAKVSKSDYEAGKKDGRDFDITKRVAGE